MQASAAPVAPPPRIEFSHDDVDAAVARAKAAGKVVFVDAWAPWCHTCLSMQAYVLTDPSLARLADRAVFVAIDTDKEQSAAFLERHAVSVWPTFFVLDPADDRVLGFWQGSASVREIADLVDESLTVRDLSRAPDAATDDPAVLLSRARHDHARRDYDRALSGYRRVAKSTRVGDRSHSLALYGVLAVQRAKGDAAGCTATGLAHLGEVTGAATPADFASLLLDCADQLPAGAKVTEARRAVAERLAALTASPPADSSADDRADALAILAEARLGLGDKAGARAANEARLAIMERAARDAPTPQAAATYDYGRALAYVALGRGDEAVRMLTEREAQMPDSYEPPARLAGVLSRLGRLPEALAAIDRALGKAYGPRKLGYLQLRADILGAAGDASAQLATLRQVVAGYEALPKGQANPRRLAEAKQKLADLESPKRDGKPKR